MISASRGLTEIIFLRSVLAMKKISPLLFALAFGTWSLTGLNRLAADDASVTLTGAHLCCDHCVDDAEAGAKTAPLPAGATVKADGDEMTVKITAKNDKDLQAAVDSVFKAGYYGKSSSETVKVADLPASDATADSLTVQDLHLCCKKCVRAFNKAALSVSGVAESSANPHDEKVTLTGKGFKTRDVLQALRDAGFGASAQ